MKIIRCPGCERELPMWANYCAFCGESQTSAEHKVIHIQKGLVYQNSPISSSQDQNERDIFTLTTHNSSHSSTINVSKQTPSTTTKPLIYEQPGSGGGEGDDDEQGLMRPPTWYKEVERPSDRSKVVYPPRPTPSSSSYAIIRYKGQIQRGLTPGVFVGISLLVMIMLVLAGTFGIFMAFGRGLLGVAQRGELNLQVTPQQAFIGRYVILTGTNFSPRARVGLTRDNAIPILNTHGSSIIEANDQGNFTDTVYVLPEWGAGSHTLNAEDAVTHKIASFPITVSGQASPIPAHLRIIPSEVDLGIGDVVTNSSKVVTLYNLGGGEVSWKATSDQPWLKTIPSGGLFVSSQTPQVRIAIDRSKLKPGPYTAQVKFSSDGGDSLVTVKAQVTAFQPSSTAIMQTTPSALSFTATDGGAAPEAQVITLNNPGSQSLKWRTTTDVDWITVSPSSGTVTPSGSISVVIAVNTSRLLPGTYNGAITFNALGNDLIKNNPQNVYVSITVTPRCFLQASQSILTFSSVYLRSAPALQTIKLGTSQNCNTGIPWTLQSNASWLTVSAKSGTTPTSLSIGVNTAGLTPGVYHGSLIFSSPAGTQTVSANFTMGEATAPLMTVPTGPLQFNAVTGEAAPGSQNILLTNSGSGTLNWQATVATASGGNWLSVSPSAGSLSGRQSISLRANASPLNTLPPGIYTGTITLTGTDETGRTVAGSPGTIPISLVVSAPCSVSAAPVGLNFSTVVGKTPGARGLLIKAGGACTHLLNWQATVIGGAWLSTNVTTGTASLAVPGVLGVSVTPAGLVPGVYTGMIRIIATDSVTKTQVGSPILVPVRLTVQPPCTLLAPSAAALSFRTEKGLNPPPQNLSIGVVGACTGSVTITPQVNMGSGTGWLKVTPASATVLAGQQATFKVTLISAALPIGYYAGSISFNAKNAGITIVDSPRITGVSLVILQGPVLSVNPASVNFDITTGTASQPVSINNTGDLPMNWTATLNADAPSFITLSNQSGVGLKGGTSATLDVLVNATGVRGGPPAYQALLTVTGVDPLTGRTMVDSIPITVYVAPPSMQVSRTTLAFSTEAGSIPASQSITVENSGGDSLVWQVGAPSQSWLTVTPDGGTNRSGIASQVSFAINSVLEPGEYSATVKITSEGGEAVTISITVSVADPPPTPTPVLGITATTLTGIPIVTPSSISTREKEN
jgi:hypothetical protein